MGYNPLYFNANAGGTSRATASGFLNATGNAISKGTVCGINLAGTLVRLDVSTESTVLAFVGLAQTDIPNGATGQLISDGRLENISTAMAVGDAVYASKTPGLLTNLKPDINIDGFARYDFVLFLGVVIKNEFNPLLKDIKLLPTLIGQL